MSSTSLNENVEVVFGLSRLLQLWSKRNHRRHKTSGSGTKGNDDDHHHYTDDESFDNNNTMALPTCFYCPTTGILLQDPVVTREGMSMERSAAEQFFGGCQLYPNRVLKGLVALVRSDNDEERNIQDPRHPLLQAAKTCTMTSRLKQWKRWCRRCILGQNDRLVFPDALYCPLSGRLLTDASLPTIAPDGYTYRDAAIRQWIGSRHAATSPVTGQPLRTQDLYPNHAVQEVMQLLAASNNPQEMANDDIPSCWTSAGGCLATCICVLPQLLCAVCNALQQHLSSMCDCVACPQTGREWERLLRHAFGYLVAIQVLALVTAAVLLIQNDQPLVGYPLLVAIVLTIMTVSMHWKKLRRWCHRRRRWRWLTVVCLTLGMTLSTMAVLMVHRPDVGYIMFIIYVILLLALLGWKVKILLDCEEEEEEEEAEEAEETGVAAEAVVENGE